MRPLAVERSWGRGLRRLLWALLCLPFLLATSQAADAPDVPFVERLDYKVSYRGVFSAMGWVDIADATLEKPQDLEMINGEQAHKTVLSVSTEGYSKIEAIYPFRYNFLSYFSPDQQRSLLINIRKKTRSEAGELVWFDWDNGSSERFRKQKSGEPDPAALDSSPLTVAENAAKPVPAFLARQLDVDVDHYQAEDAGRHPIPEVLLDRLSLLQVVRLQQLTEGQEFRLPVSNGKAIFTYRVRVEGREQLEQAGQRWDTYKLRFDGYITLNGEDVPDHPSVYMWMTADAKHVPVLICAESKIGSFNFVLQRAQPAVERLAGAETP